MGQIQPDLLGGKSVAGRRTPKARKNARIKVAPAGHADKPGTGPEGETCGGCVHMVDFHFRRTFHKCSARAGDVWKGGRATDIRPLDAACSKFTRKANALPAAAQAFDRLRVRMLDGPIELPSAETYRAELSGYQSGPARRKAWLEGDWSIDQNDAPDIGAEIIKALSATGEGFTADEIAAWVGVAPAVVRPRVSELHKAGKIRKASERRPGAAGRTLAVWLINEEGESDGRQQSLI